MMYVCSVFLSRSSLPTDKHKPASILICARVHRKPAVTTKMDAALGKLADVAPWEKQETCYKTLLTLLRNGAKYAEAAAAGGDLAAVEKFKTVNKGNAKVRERLCLDVDHAVAAVESLFTEAGFAAGAAADTLELQLDSSSSEASSVGAEKLKRVIDQVQKHAEKQGEKEFRKNRDEKIAKEIAIDKELNKGEGFARGRQNWTSQSRGGGGGGGGAGGGPMRM